MNWMTRLAGELEHGGPHVHFAAFILFNILGVVLLHFLFRIAIALLSRYTRYKEDTWRNAFRFMPTLMGLQLGSKFTQNFLSLPWFINEILNKHFHSLTIITTTWFLAHLTSSFIKSRINKRDDSESSMSILATVVDLAVYMAGFLIILSSYGISISPLLTALGAGGLASALALQDTLSNLFSGITTIVSKQVHMGDYIRLSSGESGRVVDMNWRNTTIRTDTSNTVIVPNKNIANSILTNYEQPYAECTITIPITITYGNDLQKVEEVTLDVARRILEKSEYGVTGFKPLVLYNKLGDYGISFNVVLRIRNIVDEGVLKHQFIKAIYEEYKQQGIELLIRKDVTYKE